jgi:hypothetical protein
MNHINITTEIIDEYIGILIQFDEDSTVRIRSDVVCELVEKIAAHKKHPHVQELIDRLLPTLVRASR